VSAKASWAWAVSFILVIAIKNGKEINRFTGLIDEDRIETIFDQLIR
jgi:thioredoxin-like negative regulator of GroEL